MKKNLDITKPLYSEQILPVPWAFLYRGSLYQLFGAWPRVSFRVRLSRDFSRVTPPAQMESLSLRYTG